MRNLSIILFLLCLAIAKSYSQTNWELLNPKPSSKAGKDIAFVSDDIGYILTMNELLETKDAGETWVKKLDTWPVNAIKFYENTGWIAGVNGYILKSVDGGATWTQIDAGSDRTFNSLSVIDEQTVILSTSNSILRTEDGGLNWENVSTPNWTIVKTFFTSALVGHASLSFGRIIKTVDGGHNWYTTVDTYLSSEHKFGLYFINDSVGFASKNSDRLLKTTDGGETWIDLTAVNNPIYDMNFLDENNGFISCEYGDVYKTNDGGKTWVGIPSFESYTDNSELYGVEFRDSQTGHAVGAKGRITKTTDGGNTWKDYSINYHHFSHLQFVDSDVAYARSASRFFKTIDQGDSWKLVGNVNSGSFGYSSDFTFLNETIGYARTVRNIFKTVDGAKTWTKLDLANLFFRESISSIFFLNQNIGYVSGSDSYSSKLLKTIDGGNTWSQVYDQNFDQMHFVSELVGYGHLSNKLYKTEDGGNTWSISTAHARDMLAFYFVNENVGYTVGGQMRKTVDGGNNWEAVKIPSSNYTQVKFYTNNIGYISDDYGRFYMTEDGGITWEFVRQSEINAIDIVDGKIFTAGPNGRIYRSEIDDPQPIILTAKPADLITASSARISVGAASNSGIITNLELVYYVGDVLNSIVLTPNTLVSNESINFDLELSNLTDNTKYYFYIKGQSDSMEYQSEVLSFTTLPNYKISTGQLFSLSSTEAVISGVITSNSKELNNVEFEYGVTSDELNHTITTNPNTVASNSTGGFTGKLENLSPETQYFYRLKAQYEGESVYGEVRDFTTPSPYRIALGYPRFQGSEVTLNAYINSFGKDLTDLTFEYGVTNFDNSIAATPSEVVALDARTVRATVSNLDPELNYIYRLKATHEGETVYSSEVVFNLSGDIIMMDRTVEVIQNNQLQLSALLNPNGHYITNIHFEYGLTEDFGMTLAVQPNTAAGKETYLMTATIDDPLPDQTYFYRLVGTFNGTTIYSNTYQFNTGNLKLSEVDSNVGFKIYPNPATDLLTIETASFSKLTSIKIYDTLGRLAHSGTVEFKGIAQIDISNLKQGIYIIKAVLNSGQIISSKLIRE